MAEALSFELDRNVSGVEIVLRELDLLLVFSNVSVQLQGGLRLPQIEARHARVQDNQSIGTKRWQICASSLTDFAGGWLASLACTWRMVET